MTSHSKDSTEIMIESHELVDRRTRFDISEEDGEQFKISRASVASKDIADLARLGKRQILTRNFTFLPILSFACTVIATWEATFLTLEIGLTNGGTAGTLYAFILVWAGLLSTFTTVGEMASIAPTAGGQYYWVAMLSPRFCRKFASYITGWITLIGWVAVAVSTVYLCATLIQGLIVLGTGTYDPLNWQTLLLLWGVIGFVVVFNTTLGGVLPYVEAFGMILHVVGFFAILVPMIYLSDHASVSDIFTNFQNEGNWPTQGLAFMTILSGAVFDFLGSDSVIHMAEETQNAASVSPKSMFISIVFNGFLGLAALIAIFICTDDMEAALSHETNPTGFPFMGIFLQATGSVGGTIAMSVIIFLMQTFAAIGIMAASSRMLWAFARDRGVPAWQTLVKVDKRNHIPIYAIAVTVVIEVAISFLTLAGPIVFNDVVSLTTSALLLSYFLVCALLLWRRCTGLIKYNAPVTQKIIIGDSNSLPDLNWGPWHLRGWFGIFINVVSCSFLAVVIFFSFWPVEVNPAPEDMNFSSLMFGAMMIFAVVWYLVVGKKTYEGPVIELSPDL